jgi:hypothetical protein
MALSVAAVADMGLHEFPVRLTDHGARTRQRGSQTLRGNGSACGLSALEAAVAC